MRWVLILTCLIFCISTPVSLAKGQLINEKVVQFVVSYDCDAGGHLYIRGLPSTMKIGKTYPLILTFSFEWSDISDAVIHIDGVYVGLVTEKNLIKSNNFNILIISENYPKSIKPDWIGFDFIAVDKDVKIGDKLKIEAYITPERVPNSSKAYLMFQMIGSVRGTQSHKSAIIKTSILRPVITLEVKVTPKNQTAISNTPTKKPSQPSGLEVPGFEAIIGILGIATAIFLRNTK